MCVCVCLNHRKMEGFDEMAKNTAYVASCIEKRYELQKEKERLEKEKETLKKEKEKANQASKCTQRISRDGNTVTATKPKKKTILLKSFVFFYKLGVVGGFLFCFVFFLFFFLWLFFC